MAKNDNISDLLKDIADAIREKEGSEDAINAQDFPSKIRALEIGSGEGHDEPMPKPEYYVPFYVEALRTITISFSNTYEYSRDNDTWTSATSSTIVTAEPGEKIYYRASGLTATSTSGIGMFTISGGCNLGGNLMSMLYKENYIGQSTLTQTHCFYNMFANQNGIIDVLRLALPATTLTGSCYYNMFNSCTNLVNAPALPATTLAEKCYVKMFNSCINLVNAPALPATTLAVSCYNNMFTNCSKLKKAPVLNAMIMEDSCYSNMFNTCTSLVHAPALPAITLNTYCYNNMFYYCESLETAPDLPAKSLGQYSYRQMFMGCKKINYIKAMFLNAINRDIEAWLFGVASSGTFIKNIAAQWTSAGIPSGWEILTAKE